MCRNIRVSWYNLNMKYNLLNQLKEQSKHLGISIEIVSVLEYEQYHVLRDYLSFTKSIIAVSMPITKKDGAIMASFALDKDYHQVMREKMEELVKTLPVNEYKIYVDNGPMDDRLIAELAGIGFRGNNDLIITPGKGSYQLLGEILVDIELPVTGKPLKVTCGTCTKCIDACPTKALPGNVYEKCLVGYMQQKRVYTDDIYACFQTIYGCDICQSVCPFNTKVGTKEQYTYDNLKVEDILSSTKEEFDMFKDTAFHWLGLERMQRNAIVYAANQGIDVAHLLPVGELPEYLQASIDYYERRMHQ
jgi:epoxyqueuosine reductase